MMGFVFLGLRCGTLEKMKFPVPPPLIEKPRRAPVSFLRVPELRKVFFGSVLLWMGLSLFPMGLGYWFFPFYLITVVWLRWSAYVLWFWVCINAGFLYGHWAGRRLIQPLPEQ